LCFVDFSDCENVEEDFVGNEVPEKENQDPAHTSTPNNSTSSKAGDDFGDASKRPTFRAKKRKNFDAEKEKEPSIATSTANLLVHLRQEGAKREEKDKAIALALGKLADSSAAAGEAMQTIAQAMLALVAKQGHNN
jgi:hypothetical protein